MTQRLTWMELSRLPSNARVVFAVDLDIFPPAVIPAGEHATIEENGLNEIWCTLLVKPDSRQLRHDLREWDGFVYLTPQADRWNDLSPIGVEGGLS